MPEQDRDIQPRHISGLTDRESIREFFAYLGYPADRGRRSSPEAENMSESLQQGIDHIEVIARDELGLLDVYLIEVSSVTVARIQKLTNHFKNRGGNALAVLTSDYSQLDFVLFDLRSPGAGSSRRSVQAIPRRLTVDRLKDADDRIARRVLRRFTFTEPDAIAQWNKLRSAYSIGEWSEEFFDNRGLFADYYLKERLKDRQDVWQAEGLRDTRDEIHEMLAATRAMAGGAATDESYTRSELIEPILVSLGFEVRERKGPQDADVGTPDYELMDPEGGDSLAVCLAYQWDRNLDGPDPKDQGTEDENPGAAVVSLLAEEDNEWAIVTNGKHWRIYTQRADSRAANFYQIDAEEAAADTDPEAFRYFWLMFRADAFRPREAVIDGEARHLNLLAELIEESRHYAKEVGGRLKLRVFNDIVPVLAEGFIADIRAREGQDTEFDQDRLDLIFNSTLVLLYRLLFLLYAESRDLLPVHERGGYFERSLTGLKRDIADVAGTAAGQVDAKLAKSYSDRPTDEPDIHGRLNELFEIVAAGRPRVNVPPYDGGLFVIDPDDAMDEREREVAEFLSQFAIPDFHLAKAIDRLARDPDDKTHGLVMIDYKSLGVRQLGSIYEGLLEFKLRVAKQKMAICDKSGTEVVLPYDEARKKRGVKIKTVSQAKDAPERVLAEGDTYLENSKHERKISGSYYTPEYIVSYIVEHTVGPVLEDQLEEIRPDLDAACRHFLDRNERRERAGEEPFDSVTAEDRELIERLFDFRVLDPAMGSGHFLVTAVDFISDRLIEFLNGFPGNPVERMLRETRNQIIGEISNTQVIVDEAKLTDVNLLKRHVLKRCVYGVDLNPMAVELTKVSLWLHCFTLGAPLSFLDHHLKHGNSLIGEMSTGDVLENGQQQFGGMSAWDEFSHAVSNYMTVARLADATADQVLASRRQYREAETILEPHRQSLNVQTAGYFIKDSDDGRRRWTGQADQQKTRQGKQAWQMGQNLAREHTFFHWPLEFPEAWYGEKPGTATQIAPKEPGEAGFEAVVGNPPYVTTGELRADDLDSWAYYKTVYPSASHGKYDLYMPFLERSAFLGQRAALILPSKWMQSDAGQPLRAALADEKLIERVVDFGSQQVFKTDMGDGPTTYTSICFTSRHANSTVCFAEAKATMGCERVGASEMSIDELSSGAWSFDRVAAGKDRVPTRPLEPAYRLFVGTTTNADAVFILTEAEVSDGVVQAWSEAEQRLVSIEEGVCVPFLRGRDLTRYAVRYGDSVVIYPYEQDGSAQLLSWEDLKSRYPSAASYLETHRPQLEDREDGRWQGQEDWYCHAYPRNPWMIDSRKAVVPDVGKRPQWVIPSNDRYLVHNTVYGLVEGEEQLSLEYALAVLNSRVFLAYMQDHSVPLRGGYLRVSKNFAQDFPVRRLDLRQGTPKDMVHRVDVLFGDRLTMDGHEILSIATAALRAHAMHNGPGGASGMRKDYLTALDALVPHSPMSPIIPEDPADFCGREDLVHYILERLAQRMMKLSDARYSEIDQFIGWLEAELEFDIEEMAGKTFIKAYHEHDFEELQTRLNNNNSRLGQPIDGLFGAELRDQYEASTETIRPLEKALKRTDTLIDQIVYRLYGLTEDEIAIIEDSREN